jgi:cytoskeleton protein RodZ
MSEPTRSAQEAGALLREARLKQNLHIAALAASIKVAPAKLEALEAGRFDELPDATFARALAQSVCRVLKIDAQPVLALLPTGAAVALEKVDAGLNTPFRERQGRAAPADWLLPRQPALWVALLLVGAAAAFALMPGSWVGRWTSSPSEAPTGETRVETPITPPSATDPAASIPAPAEAIAPATSTSTSAAPLDAPAASVPAAAAPAMPAAPVAAEAPAAAASGVGAQLTARQATWVQASDAKGQVLVSRIVQAGEVVELTGQRPLRLRIGNVRGTELVDRGQAIDLASRTRDNVLNLELP